MITNRGAFDIEDVPHLDAQSEVVDRLDVNRGVMLCHTSAWIGLLVREDHYPYLQQLVKPPLTSLPASPIAM